jgi:hypothetical protein
MDNNETIETKKKKAKVLLDSAVVAAEYLNAGEGAKDSLTEGPQKDFNCSQPLGCLQPSSCHCCMQYERSSLGSLLNFKL